MMKTLLFTMFCISSIMPFISTPISLSLLILVQTLILCLISRIISISSWIPMSIFLIMVGGLMIIFLYTTSLCSNVQFKIPNMKIPLMYSILSLPMFYSTPTQLLMYDNFQLMDNMNFDFLKLFTPLNIFMSMFMFIYLLTMLIIMINMMTLTKGPMRKKY